MRNFLMGGNNQVFAALSGKIAYYRCFKIYFWLYMCILLYEIAKNTMKKCRVPKIA